MIRQLVIIDQPPSGQFEERIYDVPNVWNSQQWTWVKFTNDIGLDWCGEFRGFPIEVGISKNSDYVYVLTEDHLFELYKVTGNIHRVKSQHSFKNLVITPNDDFVIYNFSEIFLLQTNIDELLEVNSPFKLDFIEFKFWDHKKFVFSCYEIGIWEDQIMEFSLENNKIEKRNAT